MSATRHGTIITGALIELPGATFTQTRGGFDTGRRQFKCLASVVSQHVPAKGSADDDFPDMKVDSVVTNYMRGGIASLDVNYLGLMRDDGFKLDEITYSVSKGSDPQTIITTSTELQNYALSEIIRPDVHHRYVRKEFPPTNIGDYIDPPKFADKLPSEVFRLPNSNSTIVFTAGFKGWRIIGEVRQAGELFEISDGYSYTYVANSAVVTL